MHLLANQADLLLHGQRLRPQHFAQDIEVALNHRNRIVDLVRDTGRQFTDGSEFLAGHQLPLSHA